MPREECPHCRAPITRPNSWFCDGCGIAFDPIDDVAQAAEADSASNNLNAHARDIKPVRLQGRLTSFLSTHCENALICLFVMFLPVSLVVWRAPGLLVWVSFGGVTLLLLLLFQTAGLVPTTSASNRNEDWRYLWGFIGAVWIVVIICTEWKWLLGSYYVLIGAGVLLVFALGADLLRRIRFYFNKCDHGVRLRPNGTRNCADCDRVASDEAERYRAERERVEREKAERRRVLQERALLRIHHIDQLKRLDPFVFEDLVLMTFERLGWSVERGRRTGDGGIDGIAKRGNETLILQCKRFVTGDVGAPFLRDLLGTVVKNKATGGVMITTVGFSKDARAWCYDQPQLQLVDGSKLLGMVHEAFSSANSIPPQFAVAVQRDTDLCSPCPQCGKPLRVVEGRWGYFIGCSGYRACRWTCSLEQFLGSTEDK